LQVLWDGKPVQVRKYDPYNNYVWTVGPYAGGVTTSWYEYTSALSNVPFAADTLTFKSVGTNPSGGGVGTYLDDVQISWRNRNTTGSAGGCSPAYRCPAYPVLREQGVPRPLRRGALVREGDPAEEVFLLERGW
jgi:hypothetical protein